MSSHLHASARAPLLRPAATTAWPLRGLHLLLGVGCAGLGVWLAANHPLSGPVAALLWVVCAVVAFMRLQLWPLALAALLPVFGLMTLTGWIVVEEVDLLVLAIAAGGYLRLATGWPPSAARPTHLVGLRSLALLAYAAALLVSMERGVQDAGGWAFGWWQGYHEPLNSVRLAKSFFLALLLLPLWRACLRADAKGTADRLRWGMVAGLCAASLVALWERLAFPGLLNFSTDYRTTAGFWEMHVGGAALDGYLALAIPFAAMSMWRARTSAGWLAAAGVVMLAVYASLTTFSRVLFIAIPLGLVVLTALESQRRGRLRRGADAAGHADAHADADADAGGFGLATASALVALFALAAWWMFSSSGWRGMLALLGATAVLLRLAGDLAGMRKRSVAAALLGGLLLASLAMAADSLFDKGAYVAYTAAFAACVSMLWRARSGNGSASVAANFGLEARAWALAAFVALLVALLLVCLHWGDANALQRGLPVAVVLLSVTLAASRMPDGAWPRSPRWQGSVLAAMATAAALVGAFGGGDYISQRIDTGGRDAQHRLTHWQHALSWLNGPMDSAWGKGLGRYPAQHLLFGTADEPPGDYRLIEPGGERRMALTGGRLDIDWGQVLRLSQRVAPPGAAATVQFQARAEHVVGVHAELCEKLLLYHGGCLFGNVEVKPGDAWQPVTLALSGDRVTGGSVWMPRPVVFSVGVLTRAGRVEIKDLHVADENGHELLRNGDFAGGMARWYFSSDHHHMPWHLKSLPIHLLFEQGWIGLALLSVLLVTGLLRVTLGAARDHALSPVLVASTLGFLVVGLIDSLLDVPRVALLFYLLLLLMLTLPAARAGPALPGRQ